MATQNDLNGCKVAILIENGFEQVEMTEPRKALQEAGALTVLISPEHGQVQAAKHDEKGDTFPVDQELSQTKPDQFDALLLPGGVRNPDVLRTNPQAVQFVKHFFLAGKPVAAICHGPWMLVEADVVRGRKVTSWPSLQTDLRNAGAEWADEVVRVDRGLVTSRKPDDIPQFNQKMIEEFAEAKTGVAAGR